MKYDSTASINLIGIPKEIKNNENRVAITPAGVVALKKSGHQVLIEQGAGLGSGFEDADYKAAGADILVEAFASSGSAAKCRYVNKTSPFRK